MRHGLIAAMRRARVVRNPFYVTTVSGWRDAEGRYAQWVGFAQWSRESGAGVETKSKRGTLRVSVRNSVLSHGDRVKAA